MTEGEKNKNLKECLEYFRERPVYKKFFSKNRLLRLILTILLISPFTILGISLSWFGKANSDLFLDNVVLARKVN